MVRQRAILITAGEIEERARDTYKKYDEMSDEERDDADFDAAAHLCERLAVSMRLAQRRKKILSERKKFCDLLRTPSDWPKKFVWDFRAPDNCAMGLGRKAGFYEVTCTDSLQKTFGLTEAESLHVFVFPKGNVNEPGVWIGDCSPEDVAQALERVG